MKDQNLNDITRLADATTAVGSLGITPIVSTQSLSDFEAGNVVDSIRNLLDVSKILENGQICADDAAKIIAYVKEYEKLSLDAMRRADIADMASKKVLNGFEAWKKEHLCILRSEIEMELNEGGAVTSLGKIIVLKYQDETPS